MRNFLFVLFSGILLAALSTPLAYSQIRRPAQQNPQVPGNDDGSGNPAGNQGKLVSKNGKTDFARANPEDINNENFPNLIESFDYPNADIAELVKAISKLTGKNFILEKGVSGKISIIAPSQITVAEAYKAFLTALAMNGFTVVPSGNFLKIRTIQNASKESIDTYAGSYFPNSDQLITRIIKLQYINAEELQKTLRPLSNQSGDMTPYPPTNSLIVTDLGSNIDRITNIISQLDVPGFEEKLVVILIHNARAKDISDIIDKIINKGDKQTNQFGSAIPRFRPGGTTGGSSGGGAANYSLVLPDQRTNSIIVVGNDAGIERIRGLVKQLDFRIRPEDGGGVYVYYVRFGEAEKIANVLNGIAQDSTKSKTQAQQAQPTIPSYPGMPGIPASTTGAQAVFGGDVKVAGVKETNSLIVTASKQDYEMVRAILRKIDVQRDQVMVKAVIMEMNSSDGAKWGIDYYKFDANSNGVGRIGFSTIPVNQVIDPTQDSGLVLGFGKGALVNLNPLGSTSTSTTGALSTGVSVPSLVSFIKFLKSNGSANILAEPQITALDNEDAVIEVGANVPVSLTTSTTATGIQSSAPERQELTLNLKITPYISPDTDSVRMKIDQKIKDLDPTNSSSLAPALQNIAQSYTTRTLQTQMVVNSGDTAVMGGLTRDQDAEKITKIPILGDLPVLGWLFKSKETNKSKINLLVFLTPRIIRNSQDSADIVNSKLNERLDFIQMNMKGRDPYGYAVDSLPRRAQADDENQEFLHKHNTDDPAMMRGDVQKQSEKSDKSGKDKGTEKNTDKKVEVPGDSNTEPLPGDYEEGE